MIDIPVFLWSAGITALVMTSGALITLWRQRRAEQRAWKAMACELHRYLPREDS